MRLTFGERAAWYEARLPTLDDPLVTFELGAIERAIPAMIALRMQVGRLAIAPLIDPGRSALVERLAESVFKQHREAEARSLALRSYARGTLVVSGRPLGELSPYDPRDLAQLREALALADTLLVPTQTSAEAIESLAGVRATQTLLLRPQAAVLAPVERRGNGYTIVIWDRTGIAALRAWFAFALRNLAAPVVVAGPGEEAQLADARVVVLTESATPLEAWRIASCGAALVVDRASGTHEWLAGVFGFDRADHDDIARAVRAALGARAPLRMAFSSPMSVPARPRIAGDARAALLVRTKNRPALLERALASVEAQDHGPTQAIVINDGGESVADLVARFPRATLIERTRSAFRTALDEAFAVVPEAIYAGVLDDDDALAPAHVSALVDALARSGSDIAICGGMHFYLRTPEDLQLTAFSAYAPPPLERSSLLVANAVPGALRVFVRRSAVVRAGGFDRGLAMAEDYELWLRLSASSDLVRVPGVNAAYSVFSNGANRSLAPSSAHADALRTIYALHPVGARPRLLAARRALLETVERLGTYPVAPPIRTLSIPRDLREKSFQG